MKGESGRVKEATHYWLAGTVNTITTLLLHSINNVLILLLAKTLTKILAILLLYMDYFITHKESRNFIKCESLREFWIGCNIGK